MRFSLADKIALIYTAQGSMRHVGAYVGLSHQKIGRLLHAPEHGGYALNSRMRTDPELTAQIDAAFARHVADVRAVSRRDDLPFTQAFPVMLSRMPLVVREWVEKIDRKTGEIVRVHQIKRDAQGRPVTVPGDRAEVRHAHWMSDVLRAKYIEALYRTKKFVNVSVGSIVDLASYNRGSNARRRQGSNALDLSRARSREILKLKIQLGFDRSRIQTPYVSMRDNQYPDLVSQNINDMLRQRHQAATGDKGTFYADRILFQLPHKDRPGNDKAKQGKKGKPKGKISRGRKGKP